MGQATNNRKFSDLELRTASRGDLLAFAVGEIRKDLADFAKKHKHHMVFHFNEIEWTLTATVKTSPVGSESENSS